MKVIEKRMCEDQKLVAHMYDREWRVKHGKKRRTISKLCSTEESFMR